MEDCYTRIIYRSDRAALYESIFTDRLSVQRSFYCLIVNQDAYSLSREEGVSLEHTVKESYAVFNIEGIELALIEYSVLCSTDLLH